MIVNLNKGQFDKEKKQGYQNFNIMVLYFE